MKPRPISVLHFTNTLARGGVEEHILSLLHGLDHERFRFCLVCPPVLAEQLRRDIPKDVDLISLDLQSPTQVASVVRLTRLLWIRRPDILHSHMFQSSRLASPLGRLCRIPVIVETPHVREAWRRGWLKGNFRIDRLVGRCVDYYIAVSRANARYLVGDKGVPARKIVLIRPGSDLSRFERTLDEPPGLRRSLGFGDRDPVLVVTGRLEAQKGHRILLEAMPLVKADFPTVRLVCLSDGSLRQDLESMTRSLGLGESVRFVGRQPNLTDWLALADFTVLPSFFEGLPLVAIESLAAGRPVVASAVDGTPEVVVDGKTGLTVPPGDPGALAQAVCQLLREPERARQMGRAGREWVSETFTLRRLIQETQDFYVRAREHAARAPRQPRQLAEGYRARPAGTAETPEITQETRPV